MRPNRRPRQGWLGQNACLPASLHARKISLALGARHILVDVDLSLDPGHRIGLVGPNGVGKSTLLRVLAGMLTPDAGTVSLAPPAATVGYLDQEPERSDETVLSYVERRTGVVAAHVELDAATAAMAAGSSGADDRYSVALDRWLALGAADLETRVGEMWASLGLSDRLLQQPMNSLSGGEAARVSLAAMMLTRFDVLLLDEPTNNLDLDSLDRLEVFVNGVQGAVALVSHDREFLRRVVTDVAELDEFTHGLTVFSGGYETYIRENVSLPASTRGRNGRSTTPSGRRWRSARSANANGPLRDCLERRSDPTTTTSSSGTSRSTRPSSWPAERRAPSGRWSGSMSSSSRASRGTCG